MSCAGPGLKKVWQRKIQLKNRKQIQSAIKPKVKGFWLEVPILLPENKIHPYAANVDEVAVVQAHGTRNRRAIHGGHFVAGADVIAVVALADLRSHLRLKPSFQTHRSHGGFADGGEFVGEDVFLAGG